MTKTEEEHIPKSGWTPLLSSPLSVLDKRLQEPLQEVDSKITVDFGSLWYRLENHGKATSEGIPLIHWWKRFKPARLRDDRMIGWKIL